MRALSERERWAIVTEKERGRSFKDIAYMLNITKSVAHRWWKRYQATESVGTAHRGRARLISAQAASKAADLLVDGGNTSKVVAQVLFEQQMTSKVVHTSTVRRRAKEQAAAEGRPILAVRGRPLKALSQTTKDKRLKFAQTHLTTDFSTTSFSDRKKFHFRYPGNKVVPVRWARKGAPTPGGAVAASHPLALNVYATMTPEGVTEATIVTGTHGYKSQYTTKAGNPAKNITAKEYTTSVLPKQLRASAALFEKLGVKDFTFQQDGDPTHKGAKTTVALFARQTGRKVTVLPNWPPSSPDLNPIENLWAYVQARVDAMGCNTFPEFQQAVIQELINVPKSMLANLYASMPRRMAMVIESGGDRTKY